MAAVTTPTPVARPRPRARWVIAPAPDPVAVQTLQAELHLPEPVCRLLCQRGYADVERAKRYLRPRLEQLHDPSTMRDLPVAVDRLVRAIRQGECIMVHGDYDVDGMCSTTLLVRTLREVGGRAEPYIPRRLQDGYDLSMSGVEAAISMDATVLVTCDCGTNALDAVAAATAAGIDVIISDHHLPSGPLPVCLAVLNPKRDGCAYPDKDLAAVGVVFKLALAVTKAMGGNEAIVFRMLDLVAMATVADIAPLRGENRVLVRAGLRVLNETNNLGLRALIRASGLEGKLITAGRVGFVLAPRLNAVGRLDHAIRGVRLLLTDDEHEANVIARELEELNRQRQEIDRETLVRASELADQLDLDEIYGIVLAAEGWHPGVIGIVASRLLERLHRPIVLVALEGESGKGSGRSISAFDLHAGLDACRDLLLRFGGHRAAAGLTIAREQLPQFAARFNEATRARLSAEDLVPQLRVDLEIPLAAATPELESLLRHFEPFGAGNPAPLLVSRGVRLACPARTVGQGHLKLRLVGDGVELEAIGFGMAGLIPELDPQLPFDVAFRLERDEWNGEPRLQAKLVDIKP